MSLFNPENHNFIDLKRKNPWNLRFFEYRAHPAVDGEINYCRLNVFVSCDGDFYQIWYGLLDSMITGGILRKKYPDIDLPKDFDFSQYDEPFLFSGHIESEEQARYILKAFRLDGRGMHELRMDEKKGLVCDSVKEGI